MNIKKLIAASGVTALIGAGLLLVGVGPASAHVPDVSIDCSTAHVSLTNYDQGASALIILDGTPLLSYNGTDGLSGTQFSGTYQHDFALTSDAAHVTHRLQVKVISTEGARFNVNFDETTDSCYTAPPPPPPVDVCSNIDGTQATIPDGYIAGDDGTCVPLPPPLPELPETKVVTSDWQDGLYACGDETQVESRTVTTTTYSYAADFTVTSADVVENQTRMVDLTAAQIAALDCPVVVVPPTDSPSPTPSPTPPVSTPSPTPPVQETRVLAHTGTSAAEYARAQAAFHAWLGVGIALLGLGLVALMFSVMKPVITRYRRKG